LAYPKFHSGLLFIISLFVFLLIYPNPRNWYNHTYHQALSFKNARLDVPTLPEYYQDKVVINNRTYLPFPPAPAILLLPFVTLTNLTQQQVSILLASLNTSLLYLLLFKYTNPKKSFILALFYAFGTVAFWTAVVGTTWYFAHTVAVFFLLLALLLINYPLLAGILIGASTLSRLPLLFSSLYFLLHYKSRKNLFNFLLSFILILSFYPIFNYLRFGNFLKTGYREISQYYINSGIPYTLFLANFPGFPHFSHLDIRNIPLHLFMFFLMPPIFNNHTISLSPYGLAVTFTSPLFLILFFQKYKTKQEKSLIVTAILIAFLDFMHYAQGWVQFGYRFLMDFIVFLMILLALKIKLNKLTLTLIIISIIVNFWGVRQAINLGW
jgi:hypothetical protein